MESSRGQTMGTYYPDSIFDGSSSGSAVAATLGLRMAALGTEVTRALFEQLFNVTHSFFRLREALLIRRRSMMSSDSSVPDALSGQTGPYRSRNDKL